MTYNIYALTNLASLAVHYHGVMLRKCAFVYTVI